LAKDLIAKRWSAYYINNGFLQESLALSPISVIDLQITNPENTESGSWELSSEDLGGRGLLSDAPWRGGIGGA